MEAIITGYFKTYQIKSEPDLLISDIFFSSFGYPSVDFASSVTTKEEIQTSAATLDKNSCF